MTEVSVQPLLPPGLPALLTYQQAADQLSISFSKIKTLVRSGKLAAVDVGERNPRIRQADLADYIGNLTPKVTS